MSVERYINALPEPGRSRLEEIRRIAYAASPDLTEAIKYDMPVFYLDGSYLFYLGGWKTHAALYPIPKHYDFEDTISPYRSGKDTVKFPVLARRTTCGAAGKYWYKLYEFRPRAGGCFLSNPRGAARPVRQRSTVTSDCTIATSPLAGTHGSPAKVPAGLKPPLIETWSPSWATSLPSVSSRVSRSPSRVAW